MTNCSVAYVRKNNSRIYALHKKEWVSNAGKTMDELRSRAIQMIGDSDDESSPREIDAVLLAMEEDYNIVVMLVEVKISKLDMELETKPMSREQYQLAKATA